MIAIHQTQEQEDSIKAQIRERVTKTKTSLQARNQLKQQQAQEINPTKIKQDPVKKKSKKV